MTVTRVENLIFDETRCRDTTSPPPITETGIHNTIFGTHTLATSWCVAHALVRNSGYCNVAHQRRATPSMHGWRITPSMHGWQVTPLHTQSSQHPDACRCHSASFHTRLHTRLVTHTHVVFTLFSSHTHGSSHAHSSPCDVAHSQPRLLTHSALRSPFLPHSQLLHGASASRPTPVRSAEFKESRRASCRHTDSSEHCSLIAVDAMQLRGVLDGAVG